MKDKQLESDGKIIAARVAAGDREACREFVELFSDLVLFRILELMKGHCHRPARDSACSIRVVLNQRRSTAVQVPAGQCDECMDSYIWFFEALKRKVGSFRGTNGCSLKTYIWSILHAKTTYIDWLRWRYGRAF